MVAVPIDLTVAALNGVKVQLDLVLDVSKSGSIKSTKPDPIKIEIRQRQIMVTSPH
jgi:hypothetical protein